MPVKKSTGLVASTPTPLEKIGDFFVKREDQSITGSHKFRSLAYQLRALAKRKIPVAVLSSSGNAAISATHFATQLNIQLFVFLSEKTAPEKLAALTVSPNATVILSPTPLRLAKYAVAHFHLPDLRPSVDQNATRGFETLGREIHAQAGSNVANIFTFVTSGASLGGIAKAYQKLKRNGKISRLPRLFGVYSTGALAGQLSGSGVEKLAHVEKICRLSGGALIAISDAEIRKTGRKLATQKIQTSAESLASYAAAEKIQPKGKTIVIFTGRIWPKKKVNSKQFQHAETFTDIDKIIAGQTEGADVFPRRKQFQHAETFADVDKIIGGSRVEACLPDRQGLGSREKSGILTAPYRSFLPLHLLPEIFLLSPDPKKIHGLEHAWPNLKILVNQKTADLEVARKRGVDITFLNLPKIKSTSDLLLRPEVQKLIPCGSSILVFKNLPRIEKIAAAQSWKILMPESKFLNLLEDKINFVEFCQKNKLPILPTTITILNQFQFKKPVVIQLRHGHAGETTFFVRTKKELSQLKKRVGEYQVKITPLQKLPTFSINLCVTRKQIYLTQPFYQITGDQRLNPNEGGTGGIDLGLAQEMLSEKTRRKILTLAERVGRALGKIGYRGIAGLDLLVNNANQKIYLVECNPRLLANLGFITRLQTESGEAPLLTAHLAEFLGIDLNKFKIPKVSQVKTGRQEVKH